MSAVLPRLRPRCGQPCPDRRERLLDRRSRRALLLPRHGIKSDLPLFRIPPLFDERIRAGETRPQVPIRNRDDGQRFTVENPSPKLRHENIGMYMEAELQRIELRNSRQCGGNGCSADRIREVGRELCLVRSCKHQPRVVSRAQICDIVTLYPAIGRLELPRHIRGSCSRVVLEVTACRRRRQRQARLSEKERRCNDQNQSAGEQHTGWCVGMRVFRLLQAYTPHVRDQE